MAATGKNKGPVAVPIGLIPTPVYPRLEAISTAKSWIGWGGYISPDVLDTVEFEYFPGTFTAAQAA